MNRIRGFYPHTRLSQLFAIILIWLMAYSSASGRMCWVDLYEYPQYIGAHIRISGPVQLPHLNDVHGVNWEDRIDSLVVGKGARITLYDQIEFQLSNDDVYLDPIHMRGLGMANDSLQQPGLTFGAAEQVEHLGVWDFHKKTKSLTIDCVK
ncbi:MAG: hypothetical protein K0U68_10875 [Gammaproteobacteria bacterium]|nr:hypothetical protein [Gammaproteobacteria bacterium]